MYENDEGVVFRPVAKREQRVKPRLLAMRSGRRPILASGTLIGAGVGKLLPAPKPSVWMPYSRQSYWRW